MAWALRASSYANDGTGFTGIVNNGTTTVTLGAAVTAGDLLVLTIMGFQAISGDATPTFSVSDSVNGSSGWAEDATRTFTLAGPTPARCSVWTKPNSGAGTPVVTVTILTATGQIQGGLQVAAFSGLATSAQVDVAASATAASGSPSSGAVAATGAANELMIGAYFDTGENTTLGAGNINGAAATLTGKHQLDAGKWQGLLEHADSGSSGGTPTATSTTTGTPTWALIAVVYKLAAGGTTPSSTDSATLTDTASNIAVSATDAFTEAELAAKRATDAATLADQVSGIGLAAADAATEAEAVAIAVTLPPAHRYSTAFPLTENPISEGGSWINGGATGLSWTNIRTTPGKMFGTQPGNSVPPYDDSIACLSSAWGVDQASETTVYIATAPVFAAEVELLLRFTITANSASGYEFNASVVPSSPYVNIVRWNGALSDFTVLISDNTISVADGDTMGFTAVGPLLTAYKNGVQILQTTDTTFERGTPGVGQYLKNQTGNNANWGLTRFVANDSGTLPSLLAAAAVLAEQTAIALAVSDSAAFAEQVAIAISAADAAALTETTNVNTGGTTPTAADTAALAAQIAIALQATDGAGLAEQMAIALARSDSATLAELVQVAIAIADAAALTEQATAAAAVGAPDSAALADQAALAVALAAADAASLVESASTTVFSGSARDWLYVIGAPQGKWIAGSPVAKWTAGAPQQ
ncbi:MAG TPA: hypothetical protein VKV73_33185 [Chloroflexota bacterium]|nr:hypothetical protein [Chloroflexota bacterium]